MIEVICGIQFEEMPHLHAAAAGVLWEKVRPEYPIVEEQPLLNEVREQFGERKGKPGVDLRDVPPWPRLFFRGRDAQ